MPEAPPAVVHPTGSTARVLAAWCCIIVFVLGTSDSTAQQPFRSHHGIVVSASGIASSVGVDILKQGGNAVDAAVATGFALAVVFPEAGNIGGGGYLLLRNHDGASAAVDFRETSPRHAASDLYLDSTGKLNGKSLDGHCSVAVPGTVAGLLMTLGKYGSMPRQTVLAPAIGLAERGFPVDARMAARLMDYADKLKLYPATVQQFFRDGRPLRAGDTLRQPDLAATLRRISESGPDDFYRGTTARLMLEEMRVGGGVMDESDLAGYHPVIREPLKGTYRGFDVLAMPPSTSGGVCLLEALNMIERFDISGMGFHSPRSVHIIAEILKKVFADRASGIGDPAFTDVPVETLISKEYATELSRLVDTGRATPAGKIRAIGIPGDDEGRNTTHFVVIDSLRNVVTVTYTVNDLFGSKVVVKGGGFFLNDEMDDFSVKPGVANAYGLTGGKANAIQPGKRPLSSMTPAIILKNGEPVLALGARGGSRIITAVLQVILNRIDFGMDVRRAVESPRFHQQWTPDEILTEENTLQADDLNILTGLGHVIKHVAPVVGACNAAGYDPAENVLEGGPDPRENASAAGY
jgi:gamma-glutamyltranspeptidase / glutathione hydrolase